MGYSVATRVRSSKKRERIREFFREHYRTYAELLGETWGPFVSNPGDCGDCKLSYDKAKTAVGVDHNASGWERVYGLSVVRWIAIQEGDRRRIFENDILQGYPIKEPVPFYVYDGEDHTPIIVLDGESGPQHPWFATDRYGLPLGQPLGSNEFFSQGLEDEAIVMATQKIKEIQDRLERRWALHRLLAQEVEQTLGILRTELQRLSSLWE